MKNKKGVVTLKKVPLCPFESRSFLRENNGFGAPLFCFELMEKSTVVAPRFIFFSPVIFFSFPILSTFFAFVVGPKNALHSASASPKLHNKLLLELHTADEVLFRRKKGQESPILLQRKELQKLWKFSLANFCPSHVSRLVQAF